MPHNIFRRTLLTGLLGVLFLPCPPARAQDVVWSGTVNDPSAGILDAALITSGSPVTFTNVDNQGFDLVVTASNLTSCGAGQPGYVPGDSWWFEGNTSGSSSVTFQFYKTDTLTPIGVTGLNFSLQDIEYNEPLLSFGYWDPSGSNFQLVTSTSPVFTYAPGQNVSSDPYLIDTDAAYAPGGQSGKTLGVDLSNVAISGFTFDPFRTSSGAGSIEMMDLGSLQAEPQGQPVPDRGPGIALSALTIAGLFWVSRRAGRAQLA